MAWQSPPSPKAMAWQSKRKKVLNLMFFMLKALFKFIYYLLVTGVIGIALLLVASMLPIPGNVQIKVVLSGSMEPAIPVGSVIVIKPVESYAVGDIVTYGKDTKTDIPTTHRIIDERTEGEDTFYKTQGDANDDPDIKELKKSAIIGKVLLTIPFLGYLIDFAKQPLGFVLFVIIPAVIVIGDEIKKIWIETRRIKRKKKEKAKNKSKRDPFFVDKDDSGKDPNE
ncbi:MAG: signal peptidase I [Candidatus Pacebacteria bacterium]|nr:signal peptidase I [Candidatus Paceibacterota bacterium]